MLVVLGSGILASMIGFFNFAQGGFVRLGGYIAYAVYNAGARSGSAWSWRRSRWARSFSSASRSRAADVPEVRLAARPGRLPARTHMPMIARALLSDGSVLPLNESTKDLWIGGGR